MAEKRRTPDCRSCLFLGSMRAAGLPSATIDAVCGRMRLRRVPRRSVVHRQGDRAGSLFALRTGRAKVSRVDADGREHVTALAGSGDILGFEAAFDESYFESAQTLTAAELCIVPAPELRSLVAAVPRFGLDLARYLWHQVSRTRDRQVYLAGLGARARVAAFLLQLLPEGPGAEPTVFHHLNLRELGGALGLAPETVCRALADLRSEGTIASGPGTVRVRDLPRLRRHARPGH